MAITVDDKSKPKSSSSSGSAKSGSRVSTPSASIAELFASRVPGQPIPGTSMVKVARPASRTVCVIHGLDGCGKSTLVTRFCPDPIQFINCDRRAEESAYDSGENYGKEIYYLDAALPSEISEFSPEYAKEVAEFLLHDIITKDFKWSIANGVRTIGIDTASEFTRILNYAHRGHPIKQKPTKEDPGDFGASDRAISEAIWYFVNKVRETRNVNLVILSRTKEEFDGPKPTGRYYADCHKVFNHACDWSAYLSLKSHEDMLRDLEAAHPGQPLTTSDLLKLQKRRPFSLKVTKGGMAIEEMDKVYTEDDWGEDGPFAYACSRLIPRTTVEDWK